MTGNTNSYQHQRKNPLFRGSGGLPPLPRGIEVNIHIGIVRVFFIRAVSVLLFHRFPVIHILTLHIVEIVKAFHSVGHLEAPMA